MDLMKEVQTSFYLLEARELLLKLEYIPLQDNTIPDWFLCLVQQGGLSIGQINFSAHPSQVRN